uniref:Rho termination factor-like N-terminal domain-containing protein n=1 Tax=Setaria italica TaxID=4555 RepID=K3XMJ4_SETIT
MGGMLLPHHQVSPNPLRKTTSAAPFALHKDGLIFCTAPRQGFLRPPCALVSVIRSELNGAVLPDAVRKHSKEELIAFFRDMQTSIAESSPKASRRTRKPPPDPFEEVDKRKQSYGMDGDGGADDFSEEQRRMVNLEDMKVADLRELARARRMRGYSKLKKGELIDRLKGVVM